MPRILALLFLVLWASVAAYGATFDRGDAVQYSAPDTISALILQQAGFTVLDSRSALTCPAGQFVNAIAVGATTQCAVPAGGGGAVSSVEGLTGAIDFATGTAGTAPLFSGVGAIVTLNIPMALTAGTTAGLISKTTYDLIPSAGEKAALAGSSGTPGAGNRYVTQNDPVNTNSRNPTAHAASHGVGQSDDLSATYATRTYAESLASGINVLSPVKAASTSTMADCAPQSIDGVSLIDGDRVLRKHQTTASANGVYLIATGGACVRTTDADENAEVTNMAVYVEEGQTNGGKMWKLTTLPPITLGTTSLSYGIWFEIPTPSGTAPTTVLTTTSGSMVIATNALSLDQWVLGVAVEVTQAITGPTSLMIGTADDPDRWGHGIATSLGTFTTIADFVGRIPAFADTTDIYVRAVGGDFTGGEVTLTVYGGTLQRLILGGGTGSGGSAFAAIRDTPASQDGQVTSIPVVSGSTLEFESTDGSVQAEVSEAQSSPQVVRVGLKANPQPLQASVDAFGGQIAGLTSANRLKLRGSDPNGTGFDFYESGGDMFFECRQGDGTPCDRIFEMAANRKTVIGTAARPDATRWTHAEPETLDVEGRTTDPASPTANRGKIYVKNDSLFFMGDNGTPVGPLGTGGGGGGGNEWAAVKAATTGPVTISNPGTVVFDGVTLSNGERVLVWQQATATENGIYLSNGSGVAMTRATDADADAEFVLDRKVDVQQGTLHGDTQFKLSNNAAITLGVTNLGFLRLGHGTYSELLANKNANSGYLGLRSDGNAVHDRIGSYAAHTALAAANSITVTARQMGLEGSGGAVDLTSNPQIVAGSREGTEVEFIGLHATNTVKLDNGTGIRLCGNTGSVIIGLNGSKPRFRWNATLTVWEQTECPDLQAGFNISNKILTGTTPATGLQIGDPAGGNYCSRFIDPASANRPTEQCFCAGGACDVSITAEGGKNIDFTLNTTLALRLPAGEPGTIDFTQMGSDPATPAASHWKGYFKSTGLFTRSSAGTIHGPYLAATTTHLRSINISAGGFETDGTQCTSPASGQIAASHRRQMITCADNDAGELYADFVMPDGWNAGTIFVENHWLSITNQSTLVVGTDWNGFCVSSGDAVPAHSATGIQTANVVFGNTTNNEQHATSAAITLNGSCVAGDHVYLRGRIRATPTTATMTNVRFLSVLVKYTRTAGSD